MLDILVLLSLDWSRIYCAGLLYIHCGVCVLYRVPCWLQYVWWFWYADLTACPRWRLTILLIRVW